MSSAILIMIADDNLRILQADGQTNSEYDLERKKAREYVLSKKFDYSKLSQAAKKLYDQVISKK